MAGLDLRNRAEAHHERGEISIIQGGLCFIDHGFLRVSLVEVILSEVARFSVWRPGTFCKKFQEASTLIDMQGVLGLGTPHTGVSEVHSSNAFESGAVATS